MFSYMAIFKGTRVEKVDKGKIMKLLGCISELISSSTMQNIIGPVRIYHLYRTFFLFYFWLVEVPAGNKNTSTSILRD